MPAPLPHRTALVGLGHIAPVHMEAMERSGKFVLVAAVDTCPVAAARAPAGVPFFTDLSAAMQRRPGLVVVATPPDVHAQLAEAAMRHGARVVVEKPAVTSEVEFTALQATAQRHDTSFFCALHAAAALDVRWLVRWVSEQSPGPVTQFESDFDDPLWQHGALAPRGQRLGGAWWDSGINALSVLGQFLDPTLLRVTSSGRDQRTTDGTVLAREVRFSDPPGVMRVNWTRGTNQKRTRLWFGESGWHAVLDHTAETVWLTHADGRHQRITLANGASRLLNHYASVYDDIDAWLRGRGDNAADALALLRLLWASPGAAP